MTLPSKRRIAEWFDDYFRHEGIDPSEGAKRIRESMEDSEVEADEDVALNFVDKIFNGSGTEVQKV